MSDDTHLRDPGSASGAAPVSAVDPLAALERLRAAAPGAGVVVLESLGPPDDAAPDSALDFLFRRLEGVFHEAVAAVREGWGTPHFHGSVEEEAFPGWSDALLLATWWHDDVVAWLAVHHDDDADPLELRAGALGPGEVEERLMWRPPGLEVGSGGVAEDA